MLAVQMEAKKASAELASQLLLMADIQQLLSSVQGRITSSQACLEEQRASLESLELQARFLSAKMPHLCAWESEVHHPGMAIKQVVSAGLLNAGPAGIAI